MRFYTKQHRHYCGIDLHTRTMFVCILDQEGNTVLHRNIPADAKQFLALIAPYREELVVGVEGIFSWYWLVDLCVMAYAYPKAMRAVRKNVEVDLALRDHFEVQIKQLENYVLRHAKHYDPRTFFARLVKCPKESAGKRYGVGGGKIGNAHLTQQSEM